MLPAAEFSSAERTTGTPASLIRATMSALVYLETTTTSGFAASTFSTPRCTWVMPATRPATLE